MFFDSTFILVLPGILLALWAQWKVKGTFAKYDKYDSRSGQSADRVARDILRRGNLPVEVEHVSGSLSDHYDPRKQVLRLSDSTYGSPSLAAIGVAAHEAGHALQHAHGYVPLSLFGLVTLPVEFNASNRAIRILSDGGYLTDEEIPAARKVLNAAAWTYVASALVAVLHLIRLLMISGVLGGSDE